MILFFHLLCCALQTNLDFIRFSSISCVNVDFTYYSKVALYCAAPFLAAVGLGVLYFIPMTLYYSRVQQPRGRAAVVNAPPASPTSLTRSGTSPMLSETGEDEPKADTAPQLRKRVRKNFWKMWIFCLFLLYPSLSASILRMYACIEVQGVSYLVADMTVKCHTDTWNLATKLGIPAIVLYPFGIPAFFFAMMWRYRHRLEEAAVRAQLGFIYGQSRFAAALLCACGVAVGLDGYRLQFL